MSRIPGIRRFFRIPLRPDRVERDVDGEIQFHLEERIEKLIGEGWEQDEAHREAYRRFGDMDRVREECREIGERREKRVRIKESLDSFWHDTRIAFRSFRRSPVFTIAAVACLGLGIGANAAVFSFLYGIIIKPLPFDEPDRLCILFETAPGFTRVSPSYPDFIDWRERSESFSDMGVYDRVVWTLKGTEGTERIDGTRVSWNLFGLLGVGPANGRGFLEEEDQQGAPATILLGSAFWKQRFGGDPGIIGQNLTLNDESHTVIGIMPEGFRFPEQADFWVPMRLGPAASRGSRNLNAAVGRLQPGISVEQAQAEMDVIAARLGELYPDSNQQRGVVVRSIADDFLWGKRTPVLIFYVVVSLVLLLACANVANLMLTRASSRRREMAISVALGAGRLRVARQLLTESTILALMGCAVGIVLGIAGRDLYLASIPEQFPYYLRFDITVPVVLAIAGIAVLCGNIFGLAPIVESSRIELLDALRDGGTTVSDSLRRGWVRSALIVVEVAMALVVLVGAGLMLKSFIRLHTVEPGFDPENVLTMEVDLPRGMEDQTEAVFSFFERARERIGSLPGVISASSVSNLPMGNSQWQSSLSVEGTGGEPPVEVSWAIGRSIQAGYFETMGIPILGGREFDDGDAADGAPEVVMVNRSFADKYWPGDEWLGKRIKWGGPDSEWPWMEVVGVVGEVRHFGLDSPIELGYYRPFSQTTFSRMTLVVRTESDPLDLVDTVRAAVWAVNPDFTVYDVRTMERVIYETHWEPAVYSRTFNIFSAIALMLAALGVYGVVAFSVVQRTREFGIRLALGARAGDVVRLAVRQVAILTCMGLLIGIAAAFLLMRLLSGLLFGVEYYDPAIYSLTALAMAAVALVAGYIPARRATRVDPVNALRNE